MVKSEINGSMYSPFNNTPNGDENIFIAVVSKEASIVLL